MELGKPWLREIFACNVDNDGVMAENELQRHQ